MPRLVQSIPRTDLRTNAEGTINMKENKPKIPEQAKRIIEALVNTPPVNKPEPRKKSG